MKHIPISQPTLPSYTKLVPPLKKIISSAALTNGKFVADFEARVQRYLGLDGVVAVSSATSGLLLVLQAMKLKGEVLVPSFTFPATAHALVWNNLKPVFIDCDRRTFNIDFEDLERKITSRTCAVMGVHVFGNPVDMERLETISRKHGLKIIIDGAHALGSRIGTTSVAAYGDATVFSLAPTKLVTSGEGGIVVVHDKRLAGDLKLARNYGNPPDYNCQFVGLNARMSELHAALAIESFKGLDAYIRRRNSLAALYRSILSDVPGISFQGIRPGDTSTFNYFATIIDEEAFGMECPALKEELWKSKIQTKRYFYPPVHAQKAYEKFNACRLPHTRYVSDHCLCLPLYTHMENKTVQAICGIIRKISARKKKGRYA